jgi:hypothetical protein
MRSATLEPDASARIFPKRSPAIARADAIDDGRSIVAMNGRGRATNGGDGNGRRHRGVAAGIYCAGDGPAPITACGPSRPTGFNS